jgi:hypothetical protein
MSVEYLLVVYKQDRDVLAGGDRAPDEYVITLSGDGAANR